MAIAPYLAMTAGEIQGNAQLPSRLAWMACHFSPYGLGLSNLPQGLPDGSLLMVDDITPIRGHDPQVILRQLKDCAETFSCAGILLDFQRPGYEAAAALAQLLTRDLSCPVCVSSLYADGLDCPLLVPPVPCHIPLAEHLAFWQGREIWLELSRGQEILSLTEAGTALVPMNASSPLPENCFAEALLHCHYRTEVTDKEARFTLWRTNGDIQQLLEEGERLGISTAVGLWQEWGTL